MAWASWTTVASSSNWPTAMRCAKSIAWEQTKDEMETDPNGYIVFDDTVLDKNHAHKIGLVRLQISRSAAALTWRGLRPGPRPLHTPISDKGFPMTHVFHRPLPSTPPVAACASGMRIQDAAGRSYLDASGGAAVSGSVMAIPMCWRPCMRR